MSDVPVLSRHDITEQLEKLYRWERKRHLVAFFGTGVEEELRFANMPPFHVVPVRSELELREKMPALDDDEARVAFLVPWGTDVPLDLSGRFARGGRIFRVGTEARLLTLLGASEIEGDAQKSPIATYLLATAAPASIKLPAGRVTLPAMWNAWLSAAWGLDVSGGLGLDTLLGWAAVDQRGARFVEAMDEAVAAGVRDGLLRYLDAKLGAAGPVVWRAWESGRGSTALAYALLFETLASSEHAGVKMWVNLAPRAALGVANEGAMAAVAKALGGSADGALRQVVNKAGATLARTIVEAADALVENADVREALAADRRLPSAWRARLDTLGRALTDAAGAPSVANVERAAAAHQGLAGHVFFADTDELVLMARAEMAVRLAAWLCARPDRDLQGAPTPHADAELLARWYAAEGGYVDWARRSARGTAEDVFGKGVNAVVRAADAAREELDRRFARALASWVDAGRPSGQVVPIDQAVKRIAVRFLEDDPSRQLLVLLMDGMAWAQAVELLQSLGARTVHWGPLAWHGSAKGKIGDGIYPAVLANLPTLTDVSRAAFFGGKALPPGAAWSTAKDVDRWAEHREVKKLFTGSAAPRLLLRAEGHTLEGSASPEALSLVADRTRRVVAIVINAIDASLKGDPQQRHAWTVESIKSLPDLLDRAREAGRAVLLASDHGHVPADRLVSKGSYKDGGARWRPWLSPGEALAPCEVGFRGEAVCSPKGAHGVVLLADDASRYGGSTHAGEHGGATPSAFASSAVLASLEGAPGDLKQIVEAVDFLLDRQGVASEAALAGAMNVPVWRIGGVVAKLGEILNVDGYQVIRHDAAQKTVHLDREKLAQQFEVAL